MANIMTKIHKTTEIDIDGNETSTIIEETKKVELSTEPDYIKIYTDMWFRFNNIPETYKNLFLCLASHMTYCNADNLEGSQLVATGGPIGKAIMDHLGITRRHYQRGLAALCKCEAIKQISRGYYQISPLYAGKGEWKYNAKLARGGVEKLVAKFTLEKDNKRKVDLEIRWSDTSSDTEIDKEMRKNIGKNTTLYEESIKNLTYDDPKALIENE